MTGPHVAKRKGGQAVALLAACAVVAALLYVLGRGVAGLPPLGTLLDPADGLYRTARRAVLPEEQTVSVAALGAPVTVLRDRRGVPHVFAESDRDAVIAVGYITAQDRLFQLDFIPRVAAGRLAEAFGSGSVAADRFLRRTGMDRGARRNLARIRREDGVEWQLLQAYTAGVNAYLERLAPEDLPLEFRLLGYRPAPYTPLQMIRLLQYMTYDLTFQTEGIAYGRLRNRLGAADFDLLYPRHPRGLFVPIIPRGYEEASAEELLSKRKRKKRQKPKKRSSPPSIRRGQGWLDRRYARPLIDHPVLRTPLLSRRGAFCSSCRTASTSSRRAPIGTVAEGFRPGKGSNNWAVYGARSATGAPLLAGDMHLSLTLPSIWYEVHLVTPTMNTYGVAAPGAPLPIEAFNDYVGWTLTNTGADVVDHYALTLDATGTRYRFDGGWRELRAVVDTIFVNGAAPVLDTLYFSHWGPVLRREEGQAIAIQWVAHDASRTLRALWQMNHARSAEEMEAALRYWDTPMQNILYATTEGAVAIRSTGRVPIRRGGSGAGLLDGSMRAGAWIGRVPFDALPHARNPARGYLTSTNQQPTDSTYAYYLGHDWQDGYRSLRIDTLLSRKARHSIADMKRYQADVRAVPQHIFAPLLDTLSIPTSRDRADALRRMLVRWNGEAVTGRPEPLVLYHFLRALRRTAWDEPAFEGVPKPEDAQLVHLLTERPGSGWLDVQATPAREDAAGLLRAALRATADTLAARYGWAPAAWRWGDHHKVVFKHLTQSEALSPLWRGPFAFPGLPSTLLQAGGRPVTHSATWRVIVDFSETPPRGIGIYPGGQRGNPFSPLYDLHLPAYLAFEYYDLLKPDAPEDLDPEQVRSRLTLVPPSS